MENKLRLSWTGFLQVVFVAANTVCIAKYLLVAATLTSFMISLIWSHNVKKIAFGTEGDRIAYAMGAAFGCLVGTVAVTYLTHG